jgi:DNA topoisomerase I
MNKILIIVESPSKASKIQSYLGDNYIVLASKGHITDLAKGGKYGLGVDIDNNFKPRYVLMPDKAQILDQLLLECKNVDQVLIASDPDREGEAIAWHLADRLDGIDKPIKRMVFNEIKKDKLIKAIKDVRDINIDLFHAQEARRILDRLVGFMASPFLMNFIGPNLSAGRVQSVVTRMIIDREREIESFSPENFWTINVNLSNNDLAFNAKYSGKLLDISSATNMFSRLNNKEYIVSDVVAEEERKYPPPPLVTSTLQRFMSKKYGFSADRTMKAAQSLYECGYCTYIRTDSVRVGDDSLSELRQWIVSQGFAIPQKPYLYKNKDTAQDAHECIRPSDLSLHPDNQMAIIHPDEKIVYDVIYKHFVASQMLPAVYNTLKITAHVISDKYAEVKASGKAVKSKGFQEVLGIEDNSKIEIPYLSIGDKLYLLSDNNIKMDKKQTQPPPRYSEDKLIKELVNKNIGRPATYADLLSKITARNYVEKHGNVYYATDLGKKITDILTSFFSFMDYNYTANMEDELDNIENGKLNHIEMLKKFFSAFKKELGKAYIDNGGLLCSKCDSPMISKSSKSSNTKFQACSAYPFCKNIQSITEVIL